MQALVEGYESTNLAALAGSTSRFDSGYDLEEMWKHGLGEAKKNLPTRPEAGGILRDYYATLVATGVMEPRLGASKIVELATDLDADLPSREYAGDGLGVAKLLGLYYAHDDVEWGDDREHDEIDAAILEECRRLIARDPA